MFNLKNNKIINLYAKVFALFFSALLILLAIFTQEFTLGLLFTGIIVILCFALSIEEILCIWIILIPFFSLFMGGFYKSYLILKCFVLFIIGLNYLIDLIKKEKKLEFKLLIPIFIYILYILLPILGKVNGKPIFGPIYNLGLIYLIYCEKEKISFKNLIVCFCISLIVASFLNFILEYIDLCENITYPLNRDTIPKFKGYFDHSNVYAGFAAFLISCLTYCVYHKQLKFKTFFALVIPIVIFGFLTISRNFLLCFVFEAVIVAIFYVFNNKKTFFKVVVPALLIFVIGFLVLSKLTNFWSSKIFDNYELDWRKNDLVYSENDWVKIFEGKQHYDTGRLGLYHLYYVFFKNNPLVFVFGRGIGFEFLGQTRSHNFIVDSIYIHGVVGVLLYLAILYFIFDLKKIKLYLNKKCLSIIIIILPFLLYQLINTYFSFVWLMLIVLAFYDRDIFEKKEFNLVEEKENRLSDSIEQVDTLKELNIKKELDIVENMKENDNNFNNKTTEKEETEKTKETKTN